MLMRSPFDMQIIFGLDFADRIERKTWIKSEFESAVHPSTCSVYNKPLNKYEVEHCTLISLIRRKKERKTSRLHSSRIIRDRGS